MNFLNFYGKLTFNGHTFQDYEIVSVGKSDPNLFAASRSITTEDGVRIPTFINFKYDSSTFAFDLIKVDKNRNPLRFSRDEIFDLQRRLYAKQEIGVLQVKDKDNIVFYGAFVGSPTETFLGGVQYLSFEFQSISPYCYSSIITNYYQVITSKTIEIYNKSSASEKIIPDIEIEMLEGNDIEIINVTTGETMTIKNMEELERLYVYGETSEFISKVDSSRNIFKLSSKNIVNLVYGKNILKINVKRAKIRLIYQYELLLY